MPIEPIAGLSFFVSVIEKIAQSLGRLRGTSKQRFSKDVVSLFEIFSELETSFEDLLSELNNIKKKSKTNLKIEDVKIINGYYKRLVIPCNNLVEWMENHQKWLQTVNILAPEIKEALGQLAEWDRRISLSDLPHRKNKEYSELDFGLLIESIRHPMSQHKIPENKIYLVINGASRFFKIALKKIRDAKEVTRIFMIDNFSVEDLF